MAKKPDYTDLDWTALTRDREEKWKDMKLACLKAGWQTIPVRKTEKFTSSLILLPIHRPVKRGIIIVCAGGGFLFKSSNEAKPVAEYFHNAGINAAILDYHVKPDVGEEENAQIEAGRDGLEAIRILRQRADELEILADKIAIGGFSAGGMLTSYTSVFFDYGNSEGDALQKVSSRPDAVLVWYGAFSSSGITSGPGQYTCEAQQMKAIEDPIRNIRTDTPPTFVFQTHKDDPRLALEYCMELANKGVPYELHTYENGNHGGGLYDGKDPDSPYTQHTCRWADEAADWLHMREFF